MRKRNNHTLIETPGAFVWLGLATWSYWTHNPVVEWIFISVTVICIVIAVIDSVKNYTPRHYRRRKRCNLHT